MSRYQKGRSRLAGNKWVPKSQFSSPAAQAALHELARCFARAAVDAMIADLESRPITDLPFQEAATAAQDARVPRPTLPEAGFLRIRDIIGDRRRGMRGLIPVSPATWYGWIAAQRAPKPIKFGRTSVWRVEDIRALLDQLSAGVPVDST